MATLAANKPRVFENTGAHPSYNEHPSIATDITYEGAAVSIDDTGNAGPLVKTQTTNGFAGFCDEKCDNSAGAAADKRVKVKDRGRVKLSVVGVTSQANVTDAVYALDDDVFTLSSSSSALQIGKVSRWISGTTCMVDFEATHGRSI